MGKPIRILVAEDNPDDLTLLLRELKCGGYEVAYRHVQTAPDFCSALDMESWDLVIADYSMPGFSGMAALDIVRKRGLDIPFILISGTIGEDLAVEAMRSGAQDYLMKGHLVRLCATIERELKDANERRERRLAQKSLRETHRKLEALINASPFAIVALDLDKSIQTWNPAAQRLFGWGEEEIIGKHLPFVPKDRARDYEPLLSNPMAMAPSDLETQAITRDNRTLDVAVAIASMMDSAGNVTGSIGFFNDVTARKQLEAQLRQSQKMEAVGQLAGGVAHDFNNLLQVIMGYTSAAAENLSKEDPVRADLVSVLAASEKAVGLTRQLLAFGRRQVLQPKDINFNQVVSDLLKMLRRVIGEHIAFDFIQGHQIGTVHADPGQMEQVLINLCVNARDAMAEGGTLTIETENVTINGDYRESHPEALGGRYLLISVCDTGHGMDEKTQSRIFEPFFTTKEEGKGTGLGLATVYGIVKQHNGFVYVYSEVGRGTTFKIYLPIVERRAVDVGPKLESISSGGDETILVAEDSEQVRNLVVRVLQTGGYKVLTAEDGEEALKVFEENIDSISMVLLDVIMPKLYGRAVFERIRTLRPSMKVLFSSGYSSNGIHTEFIAEHKAQLIQKPYVPRALLAKVREVLDEV